MENKTASLYSCGTNKKIKPAVMNKNFFLAALVTTVVLFLLNAIVFVVFLGDFFLNHPAVSSEFTKQLYRTNDQIIPWAAVVCSISIGVLVTVVTKWSGARTFLAGTKIRVCFWDSFSFLS